MTRSSMALILAPFLVFVACTKTKLQPTAEEGTVPCGEDITKYCAGVQPGEGRIIRCLDPHLNQLAPGCKVLQEKRRVAMGLDKPAAAAPTGAEVCADGEDCKKAEANTNETNKKAEKTKTGSVKMATSDRAGGGAGKTATKAPTKTK